MLELEENKRFLNDLCQKLEGVKDSLHIEDLKNELTELEAKTLEEGFWNDSQKSSSVFAKINTIKKKIDGFEKIKSELENLVELNELLSIENDESLVKELLNNSNKLENKIQEIEIQTLFSGKYDSNNAIVTLHPGARWYRITRLGRNAL